MAPGRHFKGPPETAFKSLLLQHEGELAAFIDLLRQHQVTRYLEIGAKFGGSLWRIGRALRVGSRIVAVDLPGGTAEWSLSEQSLNACVTALRDIGQDAHVMWGDSADEQTVRAVRALGPFDAVFIDGNHTLSGIRQDWANYGPLARRIVAFHDIAWRNEPQDRGYVIDAPAFWAELKPHFRHVEIRLDPTGRDNGIGVLWRPPPTP
jgi:predicted O-methyltransferase YrrM